ncbi:MAG: hypothetical protein ACHQAX_02510 [Gammaproteobacteria bacterium]
MKPQLVVNQIVRLIEAFPLVAAKLDDLPKSVQAKAKPNEVERQIQACFLTLTHNYYNVLHVIRVEATHQPAPLNDRQLKNIEENLLSFVDTLIKRSEGEALPIGDLNTELESVFITLYQILWALEGNATKRNIFFEKNKMTTTLLFMKAVELAEGLGGITNDNGFNAVSYHNVYKKFDQKHCSFEEWNEWTIHILTALDLMTVAKDTWIDTRSVQDTLIEYATHGKTIKINQMLTSTPSTMSVLFENISTILFSASYNAQFHTVTDLLGLCKRESTSGKYRIELKTLENQYSLLGLALFHEQIEIIVTLIKLQNGPQFSKMDRHLTVTFTENEWKSDLMRNTKKPAVGKTLLHLAARFNLSTLIQPLIENAGIDVNAKTCYSGKTALDFAKHHQSKEAEKELMLILSSENDVVKNMTGTKHHNDHDENVNNSHKKSKIN